MKQKNIKRGKKARASGGRFELKIHKDLEKKGWILIKNPNNVINKQFVQGKSKYNPFTKKLMMNSGGFPDFIIYTKGFYPHEIDLNQQGNLNVIKESEKVNERYVILGLEVKSLGYLKKIEKEKANWLIKNKIFSGIIIAMKKKRGAIIYKEYGRKSKSEIDMNL